MEKPCSSKEKEVFKTQSAERKGKESFVSNERLKLPESSDIKLSSYLYTINCKDKNVCSANINSKNTILACGLESSEIHIWNLKSNLLNTNQNKGESCNHNSTESSIDNHQLNEFKSELSIDLEDKNDSLFKTNRVLKGHQGSVYGLAFCVRHDLLLSCSEDSSVRAWNTESFNNVALYSDQNYSVWDVTVNTAGTYFATASMDFSARLWSFERSQPLRVYSGHSGSVDCVKFHSNSRYLATTSEKVLQLWTTEDSRSVRSFTGHDSYISSIAFSPNGQHLASADSSGCIKIWDLGSGKQIREISAHTDEILSIAYSKNSDFIASGGFDTYLKVWDVTHCIENKLSSTNTTELCMIKTELVNCHPTNSTVHFVSFNKKDLLMSVATSIHS